VELDREALRCIGGREGVNLRNSGEEVRGDSGRYGALAFLARELVRLSEESFPEAQNEQKKGQRG